MNNNNKPEQLTKNQIEGDQVLRGYFVVSKVVESPEMLQGWVDWFARLDIPCVIERRRSGFTLWRKGEEVGRNGSEEEPPLNTKNVIYNSDSVAANPLP